MDFDPYRQWLSLDDQPSNFYVLLGLRPLENDTDRIRAAASQVISRVRNAKPGDHIGAWKRLLDQIEQARESLCDPAQKQVYDQRLRDEIDAVDSSLAFSSRRLCSTRPHTMAQHVPDPMSPLGDADLPRHPPEVVPEATKPTDPAPTIQPTGVSTRRRSGSRRGGTRRKTRSAKPFALFVGAVAFLSVAWALWFVLQSNGLLVSFVFRGQPDAAVVDNGISRQSTRLTNVPPVPKPNDPHDAAATSTGEASSDDNPPDDPLPNDSSGDSPSKPVQREVPPDSGTSVEMPATMDWPSSNDADVVQLTDEELRQFGRSLQDARRLLTQRQFDKSKEHLAQARQLARTPDLELMVERLDTLHQYVHGFWLAVEDGLADIENTELVMDGNRMFVVELTPRQIILRVEGRNRRFDRDTLPPKLAMAIADRWFDPNASSTRVFKGAYMSVTPGFSGQQVRQMWRQAQQEGADLGDLTKVLDDRDWKPESATP